MDFEVTLQCLCIRVIADEFDRFYAFKNSDDPDLQRKFHFLQKVYSFEIVKELEYLDNLEEMYIEVLVNKYIKVVHSNWFQAVPWETVTAKFAEVGSNIQEILFCDHEEKRPWQRIIHYLINLEQMIFPRDCDDETLRCIAEFCPKIMEIIASYSGVTNEGMKYLCMKENEKLLCPKLKKLLIADSCVDDQGVDYLIRNLKTLEEIDHMCLPRVIVCSQIQNFNSGLDKIEPYNLTSLNLFSLYPDIKNPISFNVSNEICLTLCPRLKSLSCLIKKEEHLNLFPYELDELKLVVSDPEINVINFLKYKGRTLTILHVADCFLSVSDLAKSCPCLMQLVMQKVRFKLDNITPVLFHHLKTCTFEDTINESATVKSMSLLLTSSPKLWRITFQTCNLSSRVMNSEILRSCKCHPRKEIYVSSSTVGMDFAKEFLKDCHSLQVFELKNCDINKKDAVEFRRFAQTLPHNLVVFSDIDEKDRVDFKAELYSDIPEFKFTKST